MIVSWSDIVQVLGGSHLWNQEIWSYVLCKAFVASDYFDEVFNLVELIGLLSYRNFV